MDGKKDILNDYTLKHFIEKSFDFYKQGHWSIIHSLAISLSLDIDWLHIDYSFFTSKKRERNADGISI